MALVKAFSFNHCKHGVAKAILLVLRTTCKTSCKFFSLNYPERTLMSSTTDVLDDFTDKLIQEKSDKWKCITAQKVQSKMSYGGCQKQQDDIELDNAKIKITSVDKLLENALNMKDFKNAMLILNYCTKEHFCPSSEMLLKVASMFSRHGDKTGVCAIRKICRVYNTALLISQADYKHYLAEAAWINGNVREALDLFADVYKHSATLRRKVRNMTKFLFAECISKRSEASVVLITNFAKNFADDYKDYYFLSSLWQFCFLSEWFSDQKMAQELLEQYEGLRKAIKDKIYVIALTALKQDDVEVVHRVLEIVLRYNMRQQYTVILREYFDYKCALGDLEGCSAIISSASELNVSLKAEQHERFLVLLLDSTSKYKPFRRTKQQKRLHRPLQVPSFQLKF